MRGIVESGAAPPFVTLQRDAGIPAATPQPRRVPVALARTSGPVAPIEQTFVERAGLLDTLRVGYLAEPMFFAVIQ